MHSFLWAMNIQFFFTMGGYVALLSPIPSSKYVRWATDVQLLHMILHIYVYTNSRALLCIKANSSLGISASYWLGSFFFSSSAASSSRGTTQFSLPLILIYCHLHDVGLLCEIALVLFKGKQIFTVLVQLNHVFLLLICYTWY